MSGQLSTLNNYLDKYEPNKLIMEMVDLQNSYNRNYTIFGKDIPWLDYLRHQWIEKVKYPIFKRKVYNMTRKMVGMLYDHPDYLLLLSQRSVSFLLHYCGTYDIDESDYIHDLFGDAVSINIKMDRSVPGITNIQAYTIIVRAPIPLDVDDVTKDKYSITTLDAQLADRTYTVSQKVYDCQDATLSSTSKILFENTFKLGNDGRLINPNYSFSRELFEEDLDNYRLIIGQLLLFLSGMIEQATTLVFVDMRVHIEE